MDEPISTYARRIGVSESRVHKLLPLTWLGPTILKVTLTGLLAPRITLGDLLEAAKTLDWAAQARDLGIDPDA